jgi:predicted phage terminase large subunit-like protein
MADPREQRPRACLEQTQNELFARLTEEERQLYLEMSHLTREELTLLEYLADDNVRGRLRARRSILEFTRWTFPGYEANWHHHYVCERLDAWVRGDIRRLMLFMPPRHGKSELVSRRLPAYIFGVEPRAEVMAISYTSSLANRMSRDVQRIMTSSRYRELFPDVFLATRGNKAGWSRQDDYWEVLGYEDNDPDKQVEQRGSYRSAGILGGVTGMGATHLIIDDPVKNQEVADSPTQRNRIWEEYASSLYTRLEGEARILITLTRWHHDDLAGRLLKVAQEDPSADQWEVVSFPAVLEVGDTPHPADPRDPADSEPLWAGKFDRKRLISIKATAAQRKWEALYQQRPSPATGNIFNVEWFSQRYQVYPQNLTNIIGIWDLNFKAKESVTRNKSSYVVGQVWGKLRGVVHNGVKRDEYYLLTQFRARIGYTDTKKAIIAQYRQWGHRLRAIYIEDRANGPAILDDLKREVPLLKAIDVGQNSKETRAWVSEDLHALMQVYYPLDEAAPWMPAYVEEHLQFPHGVNDDQVDCAAHGLGILRGAVNDGSWYM